MRDGRSGDWLPQRYARPTNIIDIDVYRWASAAKPARHAGAIRWSAAVLPNVSDPEASYAHVPRDPSDWVQSLGLQMTIDGADAPSGHRSIVIHPGNDLPIATYPEAGLDHVERATAAARRLLAPGPRSHGSTGGNGAFTAALPMPFAKDSGIGIDYAAYGLAEHARAMLVNARL